MKLNENILNIEKSDDIVNRQYGIKYTAKAFKILSNQIYSDKISAVIRELSTNAYDAHVSVNKSEIPFEVHLPTKFEPYFSVKDFGPGLSEEEVYNLYTTYFESNKTHSNDYTGCLGLGSKSPFAYCDSFIIISSNNNKETTYTCYIGENGIPSIAKMGESVSTNDSGLEVKINVNSSDISEFINKAALIYLWFKTKPIIKGSSVYVPLENKYIFSGKNYGVKAVADSSYYNYYNNSYIVMGNVAYPITVDELKRAKFNDFELKIVGCGLHIFVELGEIEPTPSRESLSYTEDVIKLIKKVIAEIALDIKSQIDNSLAKAQTLWEARKIVNNLTHPVIGSINNFLTNTSSNEVNFEWNGKKILPYINIKERIKEIINKDDNINNFNYKVQRLNLKYTSTTLNKNIIYNIYANDYKIFVGDLKTGNYTIVEKWLQNNSKNDVYLLNDNKYIRQIIAEEGMEVTYTSSMKHFLKRAKNPRGNYAIINEFYSKATSNRNCDYWIPVKEAVNSGVYVIINRGSVFFNNKKIPIEKFRTMLVLITELGFSEKVYGIREKDVNKLKKTGNWKFFDEILLSYYEKNKEKYFYAHYLRNQSIIDSYYVNKFYNFIKKIKLSTESKASSLFNVFYDLYKNYTNKTNVVFGDFMYLVSLLNKMDDYNSFVKDCSFLKDLSLSIENIETRYPLLSMYNYINYSYADQKMFEIIGNYLDLIDNSIKE